MRRRLLLLFFITCISSLAFAQTQPRIRVLLGARASVIVRMEGPHRGYVDGVLRFSTPAPLSWPLRAQGDRLTVGGQPKGTPPRAFHHGHSLRSPSVTFGHSLLLEPTDGKPVSYGGWKYRGGLELVASGGEVEVINVVGLEAYLRGVVPAEMSASWPLEALKAQAVASRGYALTNLNPQGDYDICATQDCQVYKGMSAERSRSDEAVADTAGLVLTYGGGLARTYYHSDSGGYLASSASVWGEAEPYLVAKADVATNGPNSRWTLRLDPAKIAASLRAYGVNLGTVRALHVLAITQSGRALKLEIDGSSSRVVLEGEALTLLLRGWGFKSTRFTMAGDLVAAGRGYGHGVGMSQYGARSLALAGDSYQQILAFYYPHTLLAALPYSPYAQLAR
jgi:stage II sporulation protein D